MKMWKQVFARLWIGQKDSKQVSSGGRVSRRDVSRPPESKKTSQTISSSREGVKYNFRIILPVKGNHARAPQKRMDHLYHCTCCQYSDCCAYIYRRKSGLYLFDRRDFIGGFSKC